MNFTGGTLKAACLVVLVERCPTFNKVHVVFSWPPMNSMDAFFLTGDNICYCFRPFPSLAVATKQLIYSYFTFRVPLELQWVDLFRTTAGNRVFARCPPVTPPQVLIGGGLGARCYFKVQFTMIGTLLGNGESFTPENEVSVGVATFQPCTLGPDWPSLTSQAQISLLWWKLDTLHYILPKAALCLLIECSYLSLCVTGSRCDWVPNWQR